MLNALLLAMATASLSAQSVVRKAYINKTSDKGAFTFNALTSLFAALFFLFISGFDLHFTWEILPYALGFALAYGTTVLMSFYAIKIGSLSLTSLITSYSLIIPTFFGLIFLGEKAGALFYVGLGILFVSLFLMNSKHSDSKITLKWVIAVFLAFLGNGACSTVQTAQQKAFSGQYKSEMMITALLAVTVVMVVASVFAEKDEIKPAIQSGGLYAAGCGICNGICNLLVMLLAVRMDASIMFPVISAGGIVITGAVSMFLYKEKLSRGQYIALALGIASVVLMNI